MCPGLGLAPALDVVHHLGTGTVSGPTGLPLGPPQVDDVLVLVSTSQADGVDVRRHPRLLLVT